MLVRYYIKNKLELYERIIDRFDSFDEINEALNWANKRIYKIYQKGWCKYYEAKELCAMICVDVSDMFVAVERGDGPWTD